MKIKCRYCDEKFEKYELYRRHLNMYHSGRFGQYQGIRKGG